MSEHIKQIESALDLYLENPDHPAYAELGNLLRKVAGIVVTQKNEQLREENRKLAEQLKLAKQQIDECGVLLNPSQSRSPNDPS